MKKLNREKLRAFMLRRKLNTIGLLVITAISALITIICAIKGFGRTELLALVTVLLILLCILQEFKLRSSFRTIRAFKGFRRKQKNKESDSAQA